MDTLISLNYIEKWKKNEKRVEMIEMLQGRQNPDITFLSKTSESFKIFS